MIYLIRGGGWALNGGASLVPAGTMVDTTKQEWQWLKDVTPPPDVQALDQEAYDLMAETYPYNVILSGPDVTRWADPNQMKGDGRWSKSSYETTEAQHSASMLAWRKGRMLIP
jgi:hypothetical protein